MGSEEGRQSISPDPISLPEKANGRHTKLKIISTIVLLLAVTILPYWAGRRMAIMRTSLLIGFFRQISPMGWALIGWLIVTSIFICMGGAVVFKKKIWWLLSALVLYCVVQFLSGSSLLKSNFWYATYVVYKHYSLFPNALNVGIITGVLGMFIFAIVFMVLLIFAKKSSRFSLLLKGWSACAFFLVCELILICLVVLFGFVPPTNI
ncbi:MAG: hypothetical protein J6P10_00100 [Aeriscardovia sp.]|nr:hypothetical protein [Aeriscardovia sp.]